MKAIPATYVYANDFSVCVQEYEDEALLVRVSSKVVVSLGFDLSPEKAIKLADALTKHATAMLSRREAAELGCAS